MEIDEIYKAPDSEWLGSMWRAATAAYELEVWFVYDDDIHHGRVVAMGSKLMGKLVNGGRFEDIPRAAVVAAKLRLRRDWRRLDACEVCRAPMFRNEAEMVVDEYNRTLTDHGRCAHTATEPCDGDPAGKCKECGVELFHDGRGAVTDTWSGMYCNDGPGRLGRTQLHAVR